MYIYTYGQRNFIFGSASLVLTELWSSKSGQCFFSVRTGACRAGWPAPVVLTVKEYPRDPGPGDVAYLRQCFLSGVLTESRRGPGP